MLQGARVVRHVKFGTVFTDSRPVCPPVQSPHSGQEICQRKREEGEVAGFELPTFVNCTRPGIALSSSSHRASPMEDKRKKRSPKVSLPQPPPPPINPRKISVLPASKSATFSLGLPQPPSPKNRGKYKRSIGAPGQSKEVLSAVIAPPKVTRSVSLGQSQYNN